MAEASRRDRDRSRSPIRDRKDDSHSTGRHRSRSPRRDDKHRSSRDKDKDKDRDSSSSRRKESDRDRERDSSRRDDKDRERRKERERRERSPSSDEEDVVLPLGAESIGDDEYFLKATELKLWLHEKKGKKLDSLRTEDARRYFKKFCREWNKGRLSENYYAGISPASLPSSISTTHSWNFSKASQSELDAAASIRKSVDGTKVRSYDGRASASSAAPGPSYAPARGPQLGPSMPPSSAVERLQMERDARDSTSQSERAAYADKRRREARDGREEERDSRATGRDRLIEKRREGNASRKEFAAGKEGGGMIEFDDDALMNGATSGGGAAAGGGSFQDAVKARERAQNRREERRFGQADERKAEMSDKVSAYKSKEDATMAMLRDLAAKRFG